MSDATALLERIKQNTFSQEDMYRRLGVLRECIEYAVYTNTDKTQEEECIEFLSKIENQDDADVIKAWGGELFNAFNQQNTSHLLHDLQEKAHAMPLLIVYVPVAFPETEIQKMAVWAREKMDSDMLLEMHIEPTVVGGCAFVWNDTYHDFSFHGRRQEVLDAIAEEMEKYAEKL